MPKELLVRLKLAEGDKLHGFGIATNHPFVDGNERTALASMILFLGLNGIDIDAPREEPAAIVCSLAAAETTEDILAGWIAAHGAPLVAHEIVP